MKQKLQIERAVEPGGYLVRLFGTLDEGLKKDALANLRAEAVLFDLDQLRRVTSFGVNQWLAALKELKAPYYAFINCRAAVVAQFNMVTHFGGVGHLVSFYAPYLCESCDREIEVLIDLQKQHPQVAAGAPPKAACPSCQKEAVFDDLPESYFSYARSRPAPKLPPLASRLLEITKRGPLAAKESATTPAPKVQGVTTFPLPKAPEQNGDIRPLPRLSYQTQRTARLLLLDPDTPHARTLGRVLRSAAREVTIKKNFEDILPEEWDILLANYDALSEKERAQLVKTSSEKKQGRLVVYSQDPNRGDLKEVIGRSGLTNFLAKNGSVDPEELYITVHKLLSQDIFGIDKYFSWGVRSMERALRSSQEKGALLEAAVSFATDAGLQSRFVDMFAMVTRELCTNALYDAPVDAQGKHRFAHLSRDQEVHLAEGEEITVTFCCDGRRIGVSVSDPFGSLTQKNAIHYLERCFRKAEVFSHFVINAQRGQRTEIIGLLESQATYLDSTHRTKSFTIFGDLFFPMSGEALQPPSSAKRREERAQAPNPLYQAGQEPRPSPAAPLPMPPPAAPEIPPTPSPAPLLYENEAASPHRGRWRTVLAALALGLTSLVLGAVGTIVILGFQGDRAGKASLAAEPLRLSLESEPSEANITITVNGEKQEAKKSPTELMVPYGATVDLVFSKDTLHCKKSFTAIQERKIVCTLTVPSPASAP